MEVEAKLETDELSVLSGIARRRTIGGYDLRPVASRTLETIYLDTSRGELTRRRVALRVRKAETRVEVTIKLPGTTSRAVHRRPEWTWNLRRMPRWPFRPGRREVGKRLARWTKATEFVPLVGTRVRRRVLVVYSRGGGAPIAELDLDRVEFFVPGAARRGRRDGRRCYEVEVELLGGDRRDLARIVRALRKEFPLAISRRSKLERALAWARPTKRSAGSGSPPAVA